MAEDGTGQPTSIQCGYCLVKDDEMNDPRVLPCSHVFCTSCMIGQYEDVGAVTCPICSTKFEGDVDSLPQSVTEITTQLRDACLKEKGSKATAVIFPSTGSKELSKEHQQSHDGNTVDVFNTEESESEARYCSGHGGNKYTLGCQLCKKIFCSRGVTSTNLCENGKQHELIQLEKLEPMLKKTFSEKCEDVVTKEDNIAKLYKEFSKMVSDYQVETTEMVSLLQSTRDKQIQTLSEKYRLMEEELLQSRAEVKTQMETFMEEEVSNVLSALRKQRKRIEDKYRGCHQIDAVLEHESLLAKLNKLANTTVEDCKVRYTRLEPNSEGRKEPEVYLAAGCDMYISYGEEGLEKWTGPPKSVKFSKSVKILSPCNSLCYANGNIYVATHAGGLRVVDEKVIAKDFPATLGYSCGVAHHDSKVHLFLIESRRGKVASYDCLGNNLSSWTCSEICFHTRPAIVSNQFIIPDPGQKCLTVYSPSGKFIKRITGLKLSYDGMAVTAVGNNSVVVTCYKLSSVFKVNIDTGKVMWTCSDVSEPHGVTAYNQGYVCVVSAGKLSFIDSTTGFVEKVFSEPKIREYSYKMDIATFKTTAAVSKENGVHLFEFGF